MSFKMILMLRAYHNPHQPHGLQIGYGCSCSLRNARIKTRKVGSIHAPPAPTTTTTWSINYMWYSRNQCRLGRPVQRTAFYFDKCLVLHWKIDSDKQPERITFLEKWRGTEFALENKFKHPWRHYPLSIPNPNHEIKCNLASRKCNAAWRGLYKQKATLAREESTDGQEGEDI